MIELVLHYIAVVFTGLEIVLGILCLAAFNDRDKAAKAAAEDA